MASSVSSEIISHTNAGLMANNGGVINSNHNNNEMTEKPVTKTKWNPFEDPPFDEDVLFGAEFDKIRQEGSQTSTSLIFSKVSGFTKFDIQKTLI